MPIGLKRFLPLIVLPALAACGNVLEGYSPPPEIAAITETIVEKSFDETWRGLQFVAADNFFHIRELDQDAGTMVLRFDSKAPGIPPVFDCGTYRDRPRVRLPDVAVELAMNVTPVQESRTRVNLRTTYRPKSAPANVQLSDLQYFWLPLFLPIALVTAVRTTCHPTRLAERAIVDGIAKENVLGPASSDVAAKLAGWANQYRHREWSQFFFDESLLMYAQILGTDQTEVDPLLLKYADYARQNDKPADAESLSHRILEVQEKAFGRDHPSLVPTLNALASLYGDEDTYDKAEALRLRVLAISERAFGVGHSEVGLALDGLVALYREQGKLAEVEGQYKRALRLREAALVPERSGLIAVLAPLADLYDEQRRFVEAYPLHLRVLTISNDLFAPNDKKRWSAHSIGSWLQIAN